jgi:hypothetical protein
MATTEKFVFVKQQNYMCLLPMYLHDFVLLYSSYLLFSWFSLDSAMLEAGEAMEEGR